MDKENTRCIFHLPCIQLQVGRLGDCSIVSREVFSEPQHAGCAEKEKPDAKKPGIEIGNEITGYA
jgi:hypothetical protein